MNATQGCTNCDDPMCPGCPSPRLQEAFDDIDDAAATAQAIARRFWLLVAVVVVILVVCLVVMS